MNLFFSSVWQKKVWRINRSAKGLLMVTTNLDGFSLVIHQIRQTFYPPNNRGDVLCEVRKISPI